MHLSSIPYMLLSLAGGVTLASPTRRQDKRACTADVCKERAALLVRYTTANTSAVDLCEDMVSFVCEPYRAEHPIPPDYGYWDAFDDMRNDTNNIIAGYLTGSGPPIDTDIDHELFDLVKTAYDTCMDVDAVKKAGIAPVAEILRKVTELFPVDDSAYESLNSTNLEDSDGEGLGELLLYLQKNRIQNTVFGIGVGTDDKNSSVRIAGVQPPYQLTLWKEAYEEESTMSDYTSAMLAVLKAVHPNEKSKTVMTELVNQVVQLEKRVSAIIPDSADLEDPLKSYNVMSLDQTTKLAPIFGLEHVITSLSPEGFPQDRILTSFPDFIEAAGEIFMTTSKETVQTYFMWRVLNDFVYTILAEEIEPLRQLRNSLNGQDPVAFPKRSETCVSRVGHRDFLGWVISRWYLAEYFPPSAMQKVEELIQDLKDSYIETLDGLEWVEDSVADVAIKKLELMKVLIGGPYKNNPVNTSDPEAVLNFYDGVTMTESDFENFMEMRRRVNNRLWRKLGEPIEDEDWQMTAQVINAYQNVQQNAMAFPAAFLQSPQFHSDLPAYLNFAGIGQVIGHEISHGFDNNGRQYDQYGNLNDWWTNRTSEEFTKRSDCFEEQYDGFTFQGPDGETVHADGRMTANENIADSSGLNVAFQAWQKYRKENPEEDFDLPGLENWTHEQLFFLGFAEKQCGAYTPEAKVQLTRTDSHSLNEFRIKGPLQNSAAFREHFNCKVKEPTCQMWGK